MIISEGKLPFSASITVLFLIRQSRHQLKKPPKQKYWLTNLKGLSISMSFIFSKCMDELETIQIQNALSQAGFRSVMTYTIYLDNFFNMFNTLSLLTFDTHIKSFSITDNATVQKNCFVSSETMAARKLYIYFVMNKSWNKRLRLKLLLNVPLTITTMMSRAGWQRKLNVV